MEQTLHFMHTLTMVS